jgi:hypothetical protein
MFAKYVSWGIHGGDYVDIVFWDETQFNLTKLTYVSKGRADSTFREEYVDITRMRLQNVSDVLPDFTARHHRRTYIPIWN